VTEAPEWVSARDAVQRIMRATGLVASASLNAIVAYAKTGQIKARASVMTEDTHRQGSSKQTKETRDVAIPLWFWNDFATQGWPNFNWQSGVFTVRGFLGAHQATVTLTGVQFDGRGLDLLDPAPKAATADPIPLPTPRTGRPAADWWEDLIIDVFAEIYRGDLKPERQSHVEAAMQSWIEARGATASVSTVRKRARKLWEAIQREDEI